MYERENKYLRRSLASYSAEKSDRSLSSESSVAGLIRCMERPSTKLSSKIRKAIALCEQQHAAHYRELLNFVLRDFNATVLLIDESGRIVSVFGPMPIEFGGDQNLRGKRFCDCLEIDLTKVELSPCGRRSTNVWVRVGDSAPVCADLVIRQDEVSPMNQLIVELVWHTSVVEGNG